MNKRQWLALLALYVTYLFFGASVFFFLEKDQESIQRNNDYKLYEKLVAVIKECGLNRTVMSDLENYCGRPLTENADLDDITPRLWDFYNSVFFVITVVSTVGYGNIHPTTPATRAIMMFYAIIGIPMNGILLTSLAQFFSTVFIRAHKKYKRYESRCGLAVDVLKYLIPGILFFIFLPATAFYYFEDWTYDESVYYAFVTLTTIGFGDIVAGQKPFKDFDQDIILLYKSLLLCWIIFGLGYLIMILGFITRAMRSKKMAQIEHKLVEALTHSKIWHGFSKDVGYLRRIMNELYLDKFKPVYIDECRQRNYVFHRSKSLPNFAFGIDEENFFDPLERYPRKRANSDYMSSRVRLSRVCSESDLHRIDRSATFASVAKIQPDELIRHVVGVMGGSLPGHMQDDTRGIDVFSEDEILKSEAWHEKKESSAGSVNYPQTYQAILTWQKRGRALSDCPPLDNGHAVMSSNNAEWTWAGPGSDKIFNIINERHKRSLTQQNENNRNRKSGNIGWGGMWINSKRRIVKCYSEGISGSKKSISSNGEVKTFDSVSKPDLTLRDEFVPFSCDRSTKRSLQEVQIPSYRSDGHYVTYTAGSGTQGIGLMHGKQTLSKPERSLLELYKSGDHLFSRENRREALEGNSLAEFLRILSSLHNRIGTRASDDFQSCPISGGSSSPKIESLDSLFPPAELSSSKQKSNEKLQEPSNLKRLGRFLLRSYSAAPKTDSNPEKADGSQRPFSVRTNDYLADNYYTFAGNPSVKIEIDRIDDGAGMSERNFSKFSLEEPTTKQDTSKTNGLMTNICMRMRRGSTPTITTKEIRAAGDPARIGASSESVFSDSRRLPNVRWRPGESCSAKPSLSDVKEVIR